MTLRLLLLFVTIIINHHYYDYWLIQASLEQYLLGVLALEPEASLDCLSDASMASGASAGQDACAASVSGRPSGCFCSHVVAWEMYSMNRSS